LASSLCPDCGHRLHRSKSRSKIERLIRLSTRYRLNRCSNCGWRGWVPKSPHRRPVSLRTGLSFLVALIVAIVLVLYVARTINSPSAQDSQAQTP
jgi:predicted RNA-binding Zn-ribbon protein involved in translation (DUF1610 family)